MGPRVAPRPLAALVVVAAAAALCPLLLRPRPAAAYVLNRADSEVSAKLRLFEHALRNDRAWRLVLDQKVIVSDANRPAYGTRCPDGDHGCEGRGDHVHDPAVRDLVRLLDDPEATEVTAAVVLPRVLDRFAWLGSHVHYAAHVLRTALTCVTYTIVSLQIDLLAMREEATAPVAEAAAASEPVAGAAAATEPVAEASRPEPTADDQWAMLTVFVDKLAAVRGDMRQLSVLSVLLNEFADRHSPYGRHRAYLLRLVKAQMDAAVDRNCVRAPPDDVLTWLGVKLTHEHLRNDVTKRDVRCLVRSYDKASAYAMDMYDGLHVVAADMGGWKRTLDYGGAVSEGVDFHMRFEEALRADEVGRQILAEKWRWTGEQIAQAHGHPRNLVGDPQETVVEIPIVGG